MRHLEPRVIQNHRSGGPPTSIQHLQQFFFFGERTSITVIQLNPNPPKWLVSHFNLPPSYLNSRLLIITSIFMISSSNQSNPLERKGNIERPKSNLIEKQETWQRYLKSYFKFHLLLLHFCRHHMFIPLDLFPCHFLKISCVKFWCLFFFLFLSNESLI